ncbi:MAG: hypothetical protein L0Z62_33380 [Gemmataceae bacterium]|nr:hypothetical protein [Gemmataceae bacterium]
MTEARTTLTTPLVVPVRDPQIPNLPGDARIADTRLLVVREIQEDESGATLHFQQGGHGRLALRDTNYGTSLRLARRSQERAHPVGVHFGEGPAILELIRADNDVPTHLGEEEPDGARVLFQGHDGVFRLQANHPECARIRALLVEAIRQKAHVWFLAQKPDLALLDLLGAGWAVAEFNITFVVAPDHLLQTADEILRSRIRCTNTLRSDIRAVAKAYIDEADELKRAVRALQTEAARIQLETLSPPGMVEKAKRLRTVEFTNKELQEKVRAVANSYVLIAEQNQQLFDAFKEKYRDQPPPRE